MTKFWFKHFSTIYLTFPENSVDFLTQIFARNWKMPFSNAQNIRFWSEDSSETIF